MPPVQNMYDTSLGDAATQLAKRWHMSDVMGIGGAPPKGASPDDIKDWSSEQARSSVCSVLYLLQSMMVIWAADVLDKNCAQCSVCRCLRVVLQWKRSPACRLSHSWSS